MKRNKMGNLLSIAGDDAEDIKQFIGSFLSQDSESDDPEEKCVDFCKIIAVADPEDEEECLREWGVKQICTGKHQESQINLFGAWCNV